MNRYFDFKNRLLGLNKDICLNIVDNLMEYYSHYNDFFWKYFNSLYFMARCVDNTEDFHKKEEEVIEENLEKTEVALLKEDEDFKGIN